MKAPTVLIVDDNRSCVLGLAAHFLGAGFSVTCVFEGEDAEDHLRWSPSIDVLITDIVRPGLDGIELLRRAKVIAPEAIRIVVSGSGLAIRYEEARELADELISKEALPPDLVELVRRKIEERSASPYLHERPASAQNGNETVSPLLQSTDTQAVVQELRRVRRVMSRVAMETINPLYATSNVIQLLQSSSVLSKKDRELVDSAAMELRRTQQALRAALRAVRGKEI